jgi:hypothetical protein
MNIKRISPGKGTTIIGDGTLILPDNILLAAFLSMSDHNADNAQHVDPQPITEDIDCEIVEPKQLPAPEDPKRD